MKGICQRRFYWTMSDGTVVIGSVREDDKCTEIVRYRSFKWIDKTWIWEPIVNVPVEMMGYRYTVPYRRYLWEQADGSTVVMCCHDNVGDPEAASGLVEHCLQFKGWLDNDWQKVILK